MLQKTLRSCVLTFPVLQSDVPAGVHRGADKLRRARRSCATSRATTRPCWRASRRRRSASSASCAAHCRRARARRAGLPRGLCICLMHVPGRHLVTSHPLIKCSIATPGSWRRVHASDVSTVIPNTPCDTITSRARASQAALREHGRARRAGGGGRAGRGRARVAAWRTGGAARGLGRRGALRGAAVPLRAGRRAALPAGAAALPRRLSAPPGCCERGGGRLRS